MSNIPSPARVDISLKAWPATIFVLLTLGSGIVFLLLAYSALSHRLKMNYGPRYYNYNTIQHGDFLTFIVNNIPAPAQVALLGIIGVGLSLIGLMVAFYFLTGKPVYVLDSGGIHGGIFRRKHLPWGNLKMISYHGSGRNAMNPRGNRQVRIYGAPPGGTAALQFSISTENYAVDDAAIRAIVKQFRPELPADVPSGISAA